MKKTTIAFSALALFSLTAVAVSDKTHLTEKQTPQKQNRTEQKKSLDQKIQDLDTKFTWEISNTKSGIGLDILKLQGEMRMANLLLKKYQDDIDALNKLTAQLQQRDSELTIEILKLKKEIALLKLGK